MADRIGRSGGQDRTKTPGRLSYAPPADDQARLRADGRARADEDALARPGDNAAPRFVCSTCGRTDLPETGGWDPPICEECDAAINEDAMLEAEDSDFDDLDDR